MKKILLFLIWLSLAALVAVPLWLLKTTTAARLVSQAVLPDLVPSEDMSIGDVDGSLESGMTFRQVELKNLEGFPAGSMLRIQRLSIRLKSLRPEDAEADFENIRLFLPDSHPIVLTGNYRGGNIEANVYSSSVNIREILSFMPQKITGDPSGTLQDVDLFLKGPVNAVQAQGTFRILQLVLPKFTLVDSPGELALSFLRREGQFYPQGVIAVKEGKVHTKNAVLKLKESKLYFSGDFRQPHFDIKGSSVVSKTSMDVVLLGTPQNPDWDFSSNSDVPEEVLMLMFLTGKSFDSIQASVDQKKMSPDLAKDLVDYFLLGGEAGRLATKLGIKDVSILYDDKTQGIGIKQELTDSLDVGYQLEQDRTAGTTGNIKHKLDAELKLNRNISLSVDKELLPARNEVLTGDTPKPDDKVILKFKTKF